MLRGWPSLPKRIVAKIAGLRQGQDAFTEVEADIYSDQGIEQADLPNDSPEHKVALEKEHGIRERDSGTE